MPIFKPTVLDRTGKPAISTADWDSFAPTLLDLGDITHEATEINATAAILDLAGFTTFCRQVDPHLAVPTYLSRFLSWLFEALKTDIVASREEGQVRLHAPLPFLAKFLGDGLLFLWDTSDWGQKEPGTVVASMARLCNAYDQTFLPQIRKQVSTPPPGLRCGIARGKVLSVGDGKDYVGPCINIAARLQNFSLLTFCFAARGIDINQGISDVSRELLVLKKVEIRGIGKDELIYVLRSEFDALPYDEKTLFEDP